MPTLLELQKAKDAAVLEHQRCETEVIVFARLLVDARRSNEPAGVIGLYTERLARAVDAERAAGPAAIRAREELLASLSGDLSPTLTVVPR